MRTLLKGGIIVTDTQISRGDILIEEEKILAIGDFKDSDADKIYDVSGCYVMPGGIDPHTHMELQQSPDYRSVDDFYTGTVAAAVGGTTTILDHIAFGPKGCNLHYSIDIYHELAKKSVIDYGFHGVIQEVNSNILNELNDIITNEGIPSFKAYSTYGYAMTEVDFALLLRQMKISKGILTIHCENDAMTRYYQSECIKNKQLEPIYHAKSRPNMTEAETVDTLLSIAKMEGDAPVYIVHTSARESVKRIELARMIGQKNVYSETCPQYLLLDESKYYKEGPIEGTKYLMAPPLRTKEDQNYLWKAITKGSIQTIGTDHCPFMFERDKRKAANNFTLAPGGIPGVEERMIILFSEGVLKNRISLNDYVSITSTTAAKIFGMYPQKGSLAPQSDADIVVIDPSKTGVISVKNQYSVCDYNTYEGLTVNGEVHLVFSRGKLIAKDRQFCGAKGDGKFIYRMLS